MPINTRENYIEIGTSVKSDNTLNNALKLPVPIEIPASNEFLADAKRNANGTMMLQQTGRTQYTTSIKWQKLKNTKWWEINRWFDRYGYVFYMRYFSHTDGKVKIHRFYRGNIEKCTPSPKTEIIQGERVPVSYSGVGFSLIDMGEKNVRVVKELNI